MRAQSPDAIIIGAAIVDIPLVPVSQRVFETPSTPLERISMQIGGDAANESLVLARLGHSPALVSVIGRDAPGDFVLRTMADAGVSTDAVTRREGLDTGINVVLVDEAGERRFITSRSGSLRQLALSDVLPALENPALRDARVACLASLFVSPQLDVNDTAALFDALKARGLTLCADTTRRKNGETLKEVGPMLSRLDYFFPNLEEAALLTGTDDPDAIADALIGCGVGHVALKLGGRGCLLASREGRCIVPAVPGVKCVDTTGAGDTFAGAFIAALLEGKSFANCGRYANAVASLCVESVGANARTWTREDVERRFAGMK